MLCPVVMVHDINSMPQSLLLLPRSMGLPDTLLEKVVLSQCLEASLLRGGGVMQALSSCTPPPNQNNIMSTLSTKRGTMYGSYILHDLHS